MVHSFDFHAFDASVSVRSTIEIKEMQYFWINLQADWQQSIYSMST